MLPGVEALPRTLTPQDLANRRPPRLNRNMSIAEMGNSKYTPGGEPLISAIWRLELNAAFLHQVFLEDVVIGHTERPRVAALSALAVV